MRGFNNGVGAQTKLNFLNAEKLEGQELMNKVADKVIEYLDGLKNNDAVVQNKSEQVISFPYA